MLDFRTDQMPMNRIVRIMLACAASAAVSSSFGCDRPDEVTFQIVPKDQPAPPVAPALAMSTNSPGVGPSRPAEVPLHWAVPGGWVQLPDQQMRVAGFQVDPADKGAVLTVIAMPEQIPLVQNVNRWEGQVGLPATSEADLSKVAKPQQIAGVNAVTLDLRGPGDAASAKRMLGAILPHDGQTWYVKLMGSAATLEKAKPAYDAFLASLHFAHDGHTHDDPHASAAAAPTSSGDVVSRGHATADDKLAAFAVPSGWTQEAPRPMRSLTFRTGSDAGAAEVVVVKLAGNNIGPLEDNVNRWRAQVGLPPVANDQMPKAGQANVGDRQAAVYDFTGPAGAERPASRVRVVYTVLGTSVWFFKLQGPADGVAKAVLAFEAFLGSVKFPQP